MTGQLELEPKTEQVDYLFETCEHTYQYAGIKFQDIVRESDNERQRLYYDFYFCTRCLNTVYNLLNFNVLAAAPLMFEATPLQASRLEAVQ